MPADRDSETAEDATAGAVVIDLRDAAAMPDRLLSRSIKAAFLPPVTSALMPGLLDGCMAEKLDTMILSGARHGADLQHLDVLLQVAEARAGVTAGTTRIIAMAGDNPRGLLAAASFAGRSKRLIALGWDAGALATSLAAATGSEAALGQDVAAHARATVILAAAAANVMAIDTIDPETDMQSFGVSCLHARAQGFSGKMTGTLFQVPVIRSVFTD